MHGGVTAGTDSHVEHYKRASTDLQLQPLQLYENKPTIWYSMTLTV